MNHKDQDTNKWNREQEKTIEKISETQNGTFWKDKLIKL